MSFLEFLQKFSLLTFVVSSMVAVGMSVVPQSLLAPLKQWRWVAVAIALNYVLAPALAWGLTKLLSLQQSHAVGLLLVGSAAGAPFLPRVVATARGHTSQAAALLVLLTLGTIAFMPLLLPRMLPDFKATPWELARPLLLTIMVPLAAGMLSQAFVPARLTRGAAGLLSDLGSLSLLLLFGLLVTRNSRELIGVIGSGAIAAAALHFLVLFAVGWLLGGAERSTRSVMALGASARNFAAAFVPVAGATSFHDPGIVVMLTASAVVGLVLAFVAARWAGGRNAPATFGDP